MSKSNKKKTLFIFRDATNVGSLHWNGENRNVMLNMKNTFAGMRLNHISFGRMLDETNKNSWPNFYSPKAL